MSRLGTKQTECYVTFMETLNQISFCGYIISKAFDSTTSEDQDLSDGSYMTDCGLCNVDYVDFSKYFDD